MLSDKASAIFETALMFARQNLDGMLEAKHVLFALSNEDSDAKKYLNHFGLNSKNLEPKNKGRGGAVHQSQEVSHLISTADIIARQLGAPEVDCVHLLIAILSIPKTYAYEKIAFLLGEKGSSPEAFFDYIMSQIPNSKKLNSYSQFTQDVETMQPQTTTDVYARRVESATIPFSVDLTEKATIGGFDPVIGREVETERVIQTLTRRSKNNPVLVGEPGVGKTAVVEGLALAIVKGRVPAELQGKRLVELDIASMVSGTRFRGDFEERLTNTINQVIAEGNIILFIDEIHNMVGAGSTSDNSMDAAEILKPALARGELRIIGATTTREYRKYIEKDPALERRFQPIMVEEPSPELAIQIVKGVKSKYENHHNVIITDEAIKAAVELSVRYVNDRFLPDKAFDIIDESCSKLKISTFAVPKHLIDLAAELTTLKRKLDLVRLNDPQQAAVMEEKYANLLHEYEYAQFDYNQQVEEYKCKLTANDVRLVVSQMTGVPVAELSREEKDKLVHLEQELARRVIGQEEAVKVVSRAVKRQRAGIKDPNRPIGSFIFVGPTGVGKTELAKALSDLLFGSNSEVVRVDMSEYMDKQSTAKLIGAPPGYVGYDESGYLTEKIRTKPYSVVLFDEIEKAHPDVFNLLLQILDEGRLTDSHGKTVNFRNTVIILTSNIGISDSTSTFGFATKGSYETLKDNVERALKKFFRPEFLNRLDEIVLFNYLDEQSTIKITELLCFGLYKRLKGTLNLKFTDNAISLIAQQGYDKNNGARPLKRAIQRQVEDALAEKLLTGEIAQGNTVVVDAQNGKIIFTKG